REEIEHLLLDIHRVDAARRSDPLCKPKREVAVPRAEICDARAGPDLEPVEDALGLLRRGALGSQEPIGAEKAHHRRDLSTSIVAGARLPTLPRAAVASAELERCDRNLRRKRNQDASSRREARGADRERRDEVSR